MNWAPNRLAVLLLNAAEDDAAIDANCFWVLGPAAERLEPKESLAATLLL